MPDPTPERVAELLELWRDLEARWVISPDKYIPLRHGYGPLAESWQRQRAALAEKDALLRECVDLISETPFSLEDGTWKRASDLRARLRAGLPAEEADDAAAE